MGLVAREIETAIHALLIAVHPIIREHRLQPAGESSIVEARER